MEEVGSQVSFELDTTKPGEHTIDFSGQNVIIHALRSSNKKATTIIKGGNIRFRKFPKVTGQLKILATGMVYLPKEKPSLNIQIEATGGKKIWKKDDTYFDLNALDNYTIRKKIEAKQHSLALVSLITDYDSPISLTLPKCNVVVAETAASHENATFTLNAENIWIMEHQNVTGSFSATNSWTVDNGVQLHEGLKLESSNHVWPSTTDASLYHPLPSGVIQLFHFSNWK